MPYHPVNKESFSPFTRLDFLDSLRFFAITYVVISHLTLIPQPNLAIPEWIKTFVINGGDAGVSLFFVLSAFSLSYSMNMRLGESMPVSKFYIRRFFRIVPFFYFMMLLYWIRDAIAFGVIHPAYEVLINASLLFNLIPAFITGFVWASWTIGVMALLYLLFPLIHRYARNLPTVLALLAVSILMARGWFFFIINYSETMGMLKNEQVSYFWTFSFLNHLPVFVCGIVTYRLFFDYFVKMNIKTQQKCGFIFILSFIFLYAVLLTDKMQNMLWSLNILHGICFSLLVLGFGLKPFRIFVNAKTSYLGKASYSMYLLHPIIIFTIIPAYRWLYSSISMDILGYLVSLLITLVFLIVLSLISYSYIEKIGIAWGEAIIKRKRVKA
ncbi:MAG: acyltransferase [Syntrophaceae bacterium]|nr:acyltransferase [Syntrophaceae bacterium]